MTFPGKFGNPKFFIHHITLLFRLNFGDPNPPSLYQYVFFFEFLIKINPSGIYAGGSGLIYMKRKMWDFAEGPSAKLQGSVLVTTTPFPVEEWRGNGG
jgi:hypothetical protein